MNPVQRNVLQRHHQQLADDIMMTEDLFGALFQKKVFEWKMIEAIKVSSSSAEHYKASIYICCQLPWTT